MNYFDISINLPIDEFFTYANKNELKTGQRVKVEFKGRIYTGLVIRKREKPNFEVKEILKIIDLEPLIPEYFLDISDWISRYYGCSINEAIHLFVSNAIRPKESTKKNKNIRELPVLNKEQESVYLEIKKNINKFFPCLIFGVTGSGKTEIYRYLVQDIINKGKQALILIPEISLTPQTVEIHFNNTS